MRTPSWRSDGEVLDDVRVVEQHRLGDLDDQPGRRAGRWPPARPSTSGTSSPLRTWRAETLTATPRSGCVAERGDGARRPRAAPSGRASVMSGDSSASGTNSVGETSPNTRVPPAQQRLDGDGAVHDDVDDGLEDQPQLAALQGAVEVGAQGARGGPARCAGRRRSGGRRRGRRCGRCAGRGRRGAGPRRCRRRPSRAVTPATAVSADRAAGGGERADGGDQAGGHGLGVGDAAVDQDDEVAVLAAGQPVLAAQGAGEPGGERAQDGRPRCRARGPRRRARRCR